VRFRTKDDKDQTQIETPKTGAEAARFFELFVKLFDPMGNNRPYSSKDSTVITKKNKNMPFGLPRELVDVPYDDRIDGKHPSGPRPFAATIVEAVLRNDWSVAKWSFYLESGGGIEYSYNMLKQIYTHCAQILCPDDLWKGIKEAARLLKACLCSHMNLEFMRYGYSPEMVTQPNGLKIKLSVPLSTPHIGYGLHFPRWLRTKIPAGGLGALTNIITLNEKMAAGYVHGSTIMNTDEGRALRGALRQKVFDSLFIDEEQDHLKSMTTISGIISANAKIGQSSLKIASAPLPIMVMANEIKYDDVKNGRISNWWSQLSRGSLDFFDRNEMGEDMIEIVSYIACAGLMFSSTSLVNALCGTSIPNRAEWDWNVPSSRALRNFGNLQIKGDLIDGRTGGARSGNGRSGQIVGDNKGHAHTTAEVQKAAFERMNATLAGGPAKGSTNQLANWFKSQSEILQNQEKIKYLPRGDDTPKDLPWKIAGTNDFLWNTNGSALSRNQAAPRAPRIGIQQYISSDQSIAYAARFIMAKLRTMGYVYNIETHNVTSSDEAGMDTIRAYYAINGKAERIQYYTTNKDNAPSHSNDVVMTDASQSGIQSKGKGKLTANIPQKGRVLRIPITVAGDIRATQPQRGGYATRSTRGRSSMFRDS
jgi:hypothetical protein